MTTTEIQPQTRTGGRRCVVCSHPERASIENYIATGEHSIRGIARQHGIAPESMRRHIRGHVAPAVREAMEAVAGTPALSIAARLLDIADAARDIRLQADESSNARLALAAGRAEEQTLVMLAERLGVSSSDALANLHEADDVTHGVMIATRDRPEVADALAEAFGAIGRIHWASAMNARADKIREMRAIA